MGIWKLSVAVVWLAGSGALPAAAQLDDIPKPAPNMSCQYWTAERRTGDQPTMNQLAGVWKSQEIIQGVAGVMESTPQTTTITRYPGGQLVYQSEACPTMLSVPGMPPMGAACAQSFGQGEWFARPAANGGIFYAQATQGSGYNGYPTNPNCSNVLLRFEGPHTIVNQYGGQATRIGPAQ